MVLLPQVVRRLGVELAPEPSRNVDAIIRLDSSNRTEPPTGTLPQYTAPGHREVTPTRAKATRSSSRFRDPGGRPLRSTRRDQCRKPLRIDLS
jgi:hypothetical protein